MTLQLLTQLAVGASFALYIAIAIWSRAGTTGDFYVAGKGVHPVATVSYTHLTLPTILLV